MDIGFENLGGSWSARRETKCVNEDEKNDKEEEREKLLNEGFADKNELILRTCLDERFSLNNMVFMLSRLAVFNYLSLEIDLLDIIVGWFPNKP